MLSLEEKSLLENALKAHLSSLPEGGDVAPPAVDPNNITGVNDDQPAQKEEKPEIHLATPNGPQKMTGPMDKDAFHALPRSQRAKMIDAGLAPPGTNPRSYSSPGQTQDAVNSIIRSSSQPDPKVEAGENSAEQPRTQDSDLLFPPQKVTHMSEDPAERMTPSPPSVPANAGPPPGQAVKPGAGGPLAALAAQTVSNRPSEGEFAAAQEQGNRKRMIAGIGEAADSAAHQPMNLADYAISRGGGHPIETGPDTAAWANLRSEVDRPMSQLAAKLARTRQTEEDAVANRLKASEVTKNIAEAGKADREPGPKPPHDAPFDPQAFKASKKADPVFMKEFSKQFHGDRAKAEAAIDALPDDKAGLESLDRNVAGQGKALTSINVTNQNDINKIPIKGAANVGEAVTKDVVKERRNINIAKSAVSELRDAWSKVTPAELIAYKTLGVKTGALSRFDSLALASIDKTAAVESGGAARQGGINQWKDAVKNGNYTDESMNGALGGLDTALGIAEKENEGSLQGLPNMGGQLAPTVKMKFPDGSVHDVERSKLDKAKMKGGVEVGG